MICVGIRRVDSVGRLCLPKSLAEGLYGMHVSIWTDGECIFIKPLEEEVS